MLRSKKIRTVLILALVLLFLVVLVSPIKEVFEFFSTKHQFKLFNNDEIEFEKWRSENAPGNNIPSVPEVNADKPIEPEEIKEPELADIADAIPSILVQTSSPISRPPRYGNSNSRNPSSHPNIKDDKKEHAKNPQKFLGGTMKVHTTEQNINGNIMMEDSDQDAFKQYKAKGDLFQFADTLANSPASISSGKKIGVPDFALLQGLEPATKPAKKYPAIEDDWSKITIKPFNFRLYSHNIKNGGHDVLVPGEESWKGRYRQIINSIKFNSRPNTIVTLQEVYKFQMLDIMEELNKFSPQEWSYFGEGRIDGKDIGEFVPIVYKSSEWDLVFNDTIWLNEKDTRVAYEGWDAKYLRILSYVTLKHRQTGNYINVFNTHLDHTGPLSRVGSAEIITKHMNLINKWPSFLCGDLNSEPKDDAVAVLKHSLINSADHVTPFNKYGHEKSTVTGFDGLVLTAGGQSIDYIFVPRYTRKIVDETDCAFKHKESHEEMVLTLEQYGMLHSKYNGIYMSDHRPIVADFLLRPQECGKS